MQEQIDTRPIGVFDSGIGGLSVVREIMSEIPDESIIYFGDTARVPYGTKSKETIIKFAEEAIELLLAYDVKLIVSACFTVSSNAIPEIINKYDIPIVDMISPGIKALNQKKYRKIGVIGTQATIESHTFEREIKKYFKDIQIYSKNCPLFVPLAEEGWTNGKVPELVANEYLRQLKNQGVEALILGCTHYPVLAPVIRKVMGGNINIIEPGKKAAIIIKEILNKRGLKSDNGGNLKIYLSDIPRDFRRIVSEFLGYTPEVIRLIKNSAHQ